MSQLLLAGIVATSTTVSAFCKLCGYEMAYRVAEKEDLLGGPRWTLVRQILVEARNAARGDRSAKELT